MQRTAVRTGHAQAASAANMRGNGTQKHRYHDESAKREAHVGARVPMHARANPNHLPHHSRTPQTSAGLHACLAGRPRTHAGALSSGGLRQLLGCLRRAPASPGAVASEASGCCAMRRKTRANRGSSHPCCCCHRASNGSSCRPTAACASLRRCRHPCHPAPCRWRQKRPQPAGRPCRRRSSLSTTRLHRRPPLRGRGRPCRSALLPSRPEEQAAQSAHALEAHARALARTSKVGSPQRDRSAHDRRTSSS